MQNTTTVSPCSAHAHPPALFPQHLLNPPIHYTGIYQSPGDMPRAPRKSRPASQTSTPRERIDRRKPKPNPFRQPIASEVETVFRHQNWEAQRQLIRRHMLEGGAARTALDRFDNCGAECVVEWSEALQTFRLRASYCKNRHCQPCQKAKNGLISANLRNRIEVDGRVEKHKFRFLTLTLKHSDEPLTDQIKRLYDCFSRLRNTTLWKNTQLGGVSMFEVTLTDKGEWHPHLHIIMEGHFVKAEKLKAKWLAITGDSNRIDLQEVKSGKDAVHYVSKYVTKGVADNIWRDKDKAQEWLAASKGLRTATTFGSWRGYKLLQHDPATTTKDWKPIGTLQAIYQRACSGSMPDEILLIRLQEALQYDPHRKRGRGKPTTPGGKTHI